jgi:hypothetical protein
MTQNRFDRSYPERMVRTPAGKAVLMLIMIEEGCCNGLCLLEIPGLSAGAMGLKILTHMALGQVQSSAVVCLADQLLLRPGTGHCDPGGAAVLIDARFADNALDMVPILQGESQWFQDDRRHTIRTHVPIGFRIPHLTPSRRGHHIQITERHIKGRVQQKLGTRRHRHGRCPGPELLHR